MEELKKTRKNIPDTIEHVANGTSVMLSDSQQRIHKDANNLHDMKDTVVDMTKKVITSKEDVEDAITCVKTMELFGLPVIENMMDKLNSSISLMNEYSSMQHQPNGVLTTLGSAIKGVGRAGWRTSRANDSNSYGKQDTWSNIT